jgi:hypothetical protein
MRRVVSHRFLFQAVCVVLICALASSFILTAQAGLRGPGKYCGVVVFDRWDTCFLLGGPYITYVSDAVKNGLRPYNGKATQIDALDVFQPENPGDALALKYKIIGLAPDTRHWVTLDGLELVAESDFGQQGTPTFVIKIRNAGDKPVDVNSSQFGLALLGLHAVGMFWTSDGKSGAVITRGDLVNSSSWERSNDGVKYSASYTIDPESRPPERFQLAIRQSQKFRITFKVPPGKYQFMVGYGGGVHEERSLASNAISFDLNANGIAALVGPEPSGPR